MDLSSSKYSARKNRKRKTEQKDVFSDDECSLDDKEYESSAEEHDPCTSQEDSQIDDQEVAEILSTSCRKRAADGVLLEPNGPLHFKKDITSGYMPYVPGHWSPRTVYRMSTDVILDTIRTTGTEGIGRFEIGQAIGYDATVKTGGRRVTNHIMSCTTEHPDHIGQYQKMNGKVRTIRYYWKENETPEKFEKLLQEFENLAQCPCPFKIGEVIKFPDKKLNTLRISDVSLKRLNRILRMILHQRVVVTMNRMIKQISEEEMADGYKFQIDKKSVTKCLLALKNKGLLGLWDTTVRSDSVDYQIQVIGHKSIENVNDPEVYKAIQDILDSYHKEGRVFPHGQLRTFKKKEETVCTEFDDKIEAIDEDLSRSRSMKDRYHFFRIQVIRNSWKGRMVKDEEECDEVNESQKEDIEEITMDETYEEDPNQAMVNLFAKNPTVPNARKRSSAYYFGRDSLGYQAKAIRLYLIHEMAWHFVYGHKSLGETTTVFEIFPPTHAFDSWPVKDESDAQVFFDEESPYRFMPPQPKYDGVSAGWFMVQDFLAAMPLSVFVLANYVPKTIDRNALLPFLTDPIKRHLCIGYLPTEIRETLMKEKKVHKQLEHVLCLLASMGLGALGPNPSVKRFPGSSSSMFFIAPNVELVDTSSSSKGYACVNPPIEQGQYKVYEYTLDTREDVLLYWHHLRAIVQSTPLSYRMDDIGEQRCATRHKLLSLGIFDKKQVERNPSEVLQKIHPPLLRDGVGGFDSALFLHLKRHWDLLSVPHNITSWFVTKFRKYADIFRHQIENRVQVLQKDWNNFVRLTLTDGDTVKNNINLRVECPPKPLKQFRNLEVKFKEQKTTRMPKKRKPDSVDIVSSSSRVSVRCRFSSKERDQLIMIRAVGFFLNPVYRFWLDPSVLRDLMHEFVPESRNKTVQSLMACGVRELVRSNRLAYLQRVVRNLSTFPEMRRLRTDLCSTPVSPSHSKTEFFKEAFRTAMRLLFIDNDRIPSSSISDASFKNFLTSGNVSVTKENTVSNSLPHRSQKPSTISHVQHCVTTNVLLSVLIHSKNGEFAEKVLDQIPPSVLQHVLQSLRTDGLVSRSRSSDPTADVAAKNHATLSYYFRHFFSHRFHSELIDGSGRLFQEIDDVNEENIKLIGDSPEIVVVSSSTFYDNKYMLEMEVETDVLGAFSLVDKDQTIKKIRYLESADLHFEKIQVSLDKIGDFLQQDEILTEVVNFLDTGRIVKERSPFDDWVLKFDIHKRRQIRSVIQLIRTSKAAGVTTSDIQRNVKFPGDRLICILNNLNEEQQIIECGVDEQRWVSIEYEPVWTVIIGDRRWCPRPWISPIGVISLPVVRWFAESVLLAIVGKIGIQLKDLLYIYEFAVQPIAIREMIGLLEKLGCIELLERSLVSPKLASPFSSPQATEKIIYIHPAVDAIERFSRIFHKVVFLPSMTSKPI